MKLPLDLIIFDMDGTIVDTEPLAVDILRKFLGELGVSVNESHVQLITGRKWEVVSSFIQQNYQLPLPVPEFETEVLKRYREKIYNGVPTVKGSVSSVKALSVEFDLALVSGSHREDIVNILDKLGITQCFSQILGAEDYPKSKPDPSGFNVAMQILQVKPERTLIFEDSAAGIEAGIKSKSWVVAVTDTNHHQQDQSSAHLQIANFTDVDVNWIYNQPWLLPKN